MTQDLTALQLPYLLRDMLRFETGTAFALKIQCQSVGSGTLTIRGFTREGSFTLKHTLTAGMTLDSEIFRIPDIPILVSILDEAQNQVQGTCYASLSLMMNGDVVYSLCSGLVYYPKALSYPATHNEDKRANGGFITDQISANPAAGLNWSFTVPDNVYWRIIGIQATLVCAASAATRRVHLVADLNSTVFLDAFSGVDQIISETKTYTFAHFGSTPDETDNDQILVNIPDNLILRSGSVIGVSTKNIVATDNWSAASMAVEQFFDQI